MVATGKNRRGVSDHEPGTARKGCLRFLAAASARTGPHHHPARQRDARMYCAQKSQGWLRVRPRTTQPKGSYFSRSVLGRVCKKKEGGFPSFSARVCTSLRSYGPICGPVFFSAPALSCTSRILRPNSGRIAWAWRPSCRVAVFLLLLSFLDVSWSVCVSFD